MAMQQIIPGLHTFTGLIFGRVYLIEDPDGLTLIDAGLPLAASQILIQLRAAGYAPEEVKRILITHAHSDHIGGLPALKKATSARVFASALERQAIVDNLRSSSQILPESLVDHTVAEGDVIEEVMGGLKVLHTPGHTPGHIVFWQPWKKILFCGDVIVRWRKLGLPPAKPTIDMEENKRSIRRLAKLGSRVVCCGHGKPLTENAAQMMLMFVQTLGTPF